MDQPVKNFDSSFGITIRPTIEMLSRWHVRRLSKFSLRKPAVSETAENKCHPQREIRTRFAPSPTGFLHLGSLRTALYNYLLAVGHRENHPGFNSKFLLRLEDTDRNRLIEDAESNLYETMNKLGLTSDENPQIGGPYAPYRQSDRAEIYKEYSERLLKDKKAYRCFCSKERLDGLRDSARLLKPPTTVSYDRHCYNKVSHEEAEQRAANGEQHTVRLVSPPKYPTFTDVVHGAIDLQPQINPSDPRFDDPVLLKSDGMPTYHFANVVDDHLMKITHVIRGEEWLASTPKHVSLYEAFGWKDTMPKFVHIPLLTNLEGKKLSKRHGDVNVWSLLEKGYEVEAVINFAVLFGWNPKRELGEKTSDVFTLPELVKLWTGEESLQELTKSNVKVDWKKLDYLNKQHLHNKMNDPLLRNDFIDSQAERYLPNVVSKWNVDVSLQHMRRAIELVGPGVVKLRDLVNDEFRWVYTSPLRQSFDKEIEKLKLSTGLNDLDALKHIVGKVHHHVDDIISANGKLNPVVKTIASEFGGSTIKNKHVFKVIRHALCESDSGVNLHDVIQVIGTNETKARINELNDIINA